MSLAVNPVLAMVTRLASALSSDETTHSSVVVTFPSVRVISALSSVNEAT